MPMTVPTSEAAVPAMMPKAKKEKDNANKELLLRRLHLKVDARCFFEK
jgi:hypothetical protein